MGIIEVLGIGVGLAMDAFAVSVCKGLKMKKYNFKQAIIICLFFGGFQAVMPLIGYFVGSIFKDYITEFDHWIAFALLCYLGIKTIIDVIKDKEEKEDKSSVRSANGNHNEEKFDYKELVIMAVATSIDALAVGITFAFDLSINIFVSIAVIGVITAVICLAGTLIGFKFGSKYKKTAEIIGGVVLILIGLKILLEGLGVLPF